jgi:hypothetical protein
VIENNLPAHPSKSPTRDFVLPNFTPIDGGSSSKFRSADLIEVIKFIWSTQSCSVSTSLSKWFEDGQMLTPQRLADIAKSRNDNLWVSFPNEFGVPSTRHACPCISQNELPFQISRIMKHFLEERRPQFANEILWNLTN